MNQLSLLDAPIARHNDPATSHIAAAEKVGKLNALQQAFMGEIRNGGESTAAEAAARCAVRFGGMAESYRKRAGELVRKGVLVTSGVRKCSISGKLATVYRVK